MLDQHRIFLKEPLKLLFISVRLSIFFSDLQTHAVEPDGQRYPSGDFAVWTFTRHLYFSFDGVEGGHQIQYVLLEWEEEDVGVQSEFELSGDLEIAVDAGDSSTLVCD